MYGLLDLKCSFNVIIENSPFKKCWVPRWRRGIVLDLQSGVPGFIPRWRPMPGLYAASIRHLKWQYRENFLTRSIYRWLFIDTEQWDWPISHDPPVWCVGTAALTRSAVVSTPIMALVVAQKISIARGWYQMATLHIVVWWQIIKKYSRKTRSTELCVSP